MHTYVRKLVTFTCKDDPSRSSFWSPDLMVLYYNQKINLPIFTFTESVYAFHSCLCDRCCDFPDSICFCCWVRRLLVIRGVSFLIREVVFTVVVCRSQMGWNHLKTLLLWCTEQLFQTCNHLSWRQTWKFIPSCRSGKWVVTHFFSCSLTVGTGAACNVMSR